MRADAYIVIDLETGSLCVTTSQSGERVFDGESFVFRDSIVSVSLPGATVDPLSVSLGSGSLSVKVVSELTPGSILSSRSTIAGSRCRCWVELENGSIIERFLGQVDSASFGLNEDTIEFSMSPLQDISLVEYPSHGYMDEGRFVERVSFVSTEQGGFTQEISVLRPAMEFKTIFGTPSRPGFLSYQFQSLAVPQSAPRVVQRLLGLELVADGGLERRLELAEGDGAVLGVGNVDATILVDEVGEYAYA